MGPEQPEPLYMTGGTERHFVGCALHCCRRAWRSCSVGLASTGLCTTLKCAATSVLRTCCEVHGGVLLEVESRCTTDVHGTLQ